MNETWMLVAALVLFGVVLMLVHFAEIDEEARKNGYLLDESGGDGD